MASRLYCTTGTAAVPTAGLDCSSEGIGSWGGREIAQGQTLSTLSLISSALSCRLHPDHAVSKAVVCCQECIFSDPMQKQLQSGLICEHAGIRFDCLCRLNTFEATLKLPMLDQEVRHNQYRRTVLLDPIEGDPSMSAGAVLLAVLWWVSIPCADACRWLGKPRCPSSSLSRRRAV